MKLPDPLMLARIIHRLLSSRDRDVPHTVALELTAMLINNTTRWPHAADWSGWQNGWFTIHCYESTPGGLLQPEPKQNKSQRAVIVGRSGCWELARLEDGFAVSLAKQHQWIRIRLKSDARTGT